MIYYFITYFFYFSFLIFLFLAFLWLFEHFGGLPFDLFIVVLRILLCIVNGSSRYNLLSALEEYFATSSLYVQFK